jgi:hypothetical protein
MNFVMENDSVNDNVTIDDDEQLSIGNNHYAVSCVAIVAGSHHLMVAPVQLFPNIYMSKSERALKKGRSMSNNSNNNVK